VATLKREPATIQATSEQGRKEKLGVRVAVVG